MFSLKNLRISYKVFGGFGIVIAILLVVGVVGYEALATARGNLEEYRALDRQTDVLGRLQDTLLQTRIEVKSFIVNASDAAARGVTKKAGLVEGLTDEAAALARNSQEKGQAAEMKRELADYSKAFDGIVSREKVRRLESERMAEAAGKVQDSLVQLMKTAQAENDAAAVLTSGLVLQEFLAVRVHMTRLIFDGATVDYEKGTKELLGLNQRMAGLERDADQPARKALAREVVERLEDYSGAYVKIRTALQERDALIDSQLDKIGPAVAALAAETANAVQQRQNTIGEQTASKTQGAVRTLLTILAVGTAFGTLAAALIGLGISRPVIAMTGAMVRLANRDLTVVIPATDHRDEVGAMAKAVQVFKDNAIQVDRLAAEQKEREQKAEAEKSAALRALADQFEGAVGGIVNQVAEAAGELQGSSEAMSASAEQTTQQATAVAAASEQASSNVQTVATAAEELSSSIGEIGRQVAQASQIASGAVREAGETNGRIRGLAEAVQKIGEVVDLITDIADQTNLLALNATIEAARAGDAGKGFAVVASEVKNLANQTAKATEQISSQIAGVQASTLEAVAAIATITKVIEEVDEINSTIAAAVEEQSAATQEIARNVEQASAGTQEVSSNITGVTQAAKDTGIAASNIRDASVRLTRQSESLRSEVDTFLNTVRAG